ncbi:hypothetical protein DHEL01_v201526 [Diaporthe helianthi]|uniref:Uncharacterized protein n=1 Tax=Diaporthe helianthi TaxID=158607 RepID=A0A2P5IC35_DIAHE|nr:hypothetical protein DHEL01_v201526 [Diaporthe helianthi]
MDWTALCSHGAKMPTCPYLGMEVKPCACSVGSLDIWSRAPTGLPKGYLLRTLPGQARPGPLLYRVAALPTVVAAGKMLATTVQQDQSSTRHPPAAKIAGCSGSAAIIHHRDVICWLVFVGAHPPQASAFFRAHEDLVRHPVTPGVATCRSQIEEGNEEGNEDRQQNKCIPRQYASACTYCTWAAWVKMQLSTVRSKEYSPPELQRVRTVSETHWLMVWPKTPAPPNCMMSFVHGPFTESAV